MSDPHNPKDSRVGNQDGEVRDVDDPEVQQDTVSGGAPDEPDTPDDTYAPDAGESEESGA